MKITAFFLLISISSVFANFSYSQNTRFSLRLENVTIQQVFDEIQKKSEFIVFYKDDQVDLNHPSNVDVVEGTVDQILDQALKGTNLGYKIIDRQIVILTDKTKDSPSFIKSETNVEQKKELSGTVKDSKGIPLPGVSIVVKGTTTGITTDSDGQFRLSVPANAKTLVFSFIGMKTQEIVISEKTTFVVVMEEVTVGLEEVVAVGYGSQRKRDVTGATSTIKSDVIVSRPLTRVDQVLQGTTPGVSVVSQTGNPGSGLAVRIRGINSINGSNDPLYVIDGYVGGSLQSIALEDIASLEVLKDASATAIYGSRGSNGVVLVTTKSGKIGKMKVDFNTWISQASMPRYLDVMNARDFAEMRDKARTILFPTPGTTEFTEGVSTNWQKELTRSALIKNYQLSISGGTSDIKYLISGNYLDQPGIVLNSWYKKGSLRANIDVKANDKLDLKFNIAAFQSKGHNNGYEGGSWDPFSLTMTWDPTKPLRDVNGDYTFLSAYADGRVNPMCQAMGMVSDRTTSNFNGTGALVYKIIKGLTFTSTTTYEAEFQYSPSLTGLKTIDGWQNKKDGAGVTNNRYWSFQNSNYFTYKADFGEHALTVTALYEQQQRENSWVNARASGLSTYSDGYYNLGLGKGQFTTSDYWADGLQSYMGRVNYSYKDKYLLTASVRVDGSSHLIDKYSTFPSVALGWNVLKESFLQNAQLLSTLKLRASYGKTGNQAVGAYSTIPNIYVGNPYYFTSTPSVSTPLGTGKGKELKWETTAQYNVGLDAGFFKGRLTFTADAYKKTVSDLLYNNPICGYLGGGSYQKNLGTLENKGLELSIGGKPVSSNAVKWNTYFTISFNRNKIVDMKGLDKILANNSSSILKVGQPIGMFYGYQFLGTWKTGEIPGITYVENNVTKTYYGGALAGSSKYLDVNGDKKYDAADMMMIGCGQPDYTFGFTNDVSFGSFTLNIMFQGMHGNQIYNYGIAQMYGGSGDVKDGTSQDIKDNMWSATKETEFPVVGAKNYFTNSSRFVYDGSFIKLKNVSLSYRLPESVLKSLKMSGLEVYVSGQNVLCITKYKGFDPEATTAGGNALNQGFDTAAIPNPKTYTIGLRASF